MTPEGKVKKEVKSLLAQYDIQNAKDAGLYDTADGWYFMASQNGRGVSGIPDFVGVYQGYFWAIETKAPGKKPEGFQALQIDAIRAGTGKVFVVDGEESLAEFEAWLKYVKSRTVRG